MTAADHSRSTHDARGKDREASSDIPNLDADLLETQQSLSGTEREGLAGVSTLPTRWSATLRRWAGMLGSFMLAQGLVQASGLFAGLLLVNFLSVEEFAIYTLASSILVSVTFFADLGTSSAFLHFFHHTQGHSERFAPFAEAARWLRRALFALVTPVAAVAYFIWASQMGVSTGSLLFQCILILCAAGLQVSGALSILRLRLRECFRESYRAEVSGALVRLCLVGALVVGGSMNSELALLTTLAGAATLVALTRARHARSSIDPGARVESRRAVVRYLLPTLPGAVYFAVQGQFLVWLAAAAGGTAQIAQLGALSRLGLILGVFSGINAVLLLPKLASSPDEVTFRRRYVQAFLFLAVVSIALLLSGSAFPELFLSLLGSSYDQLNYELLLVFATAGVSHLGGFAVGVNNARSWTRWQVLATIFWVAFQVALAFYLPLSELEGLLLFGLYSAIFTAVFQLGTNAVGFVRPQWVRWA